MPPRCREPVTMRGHSRHRGEEAQEDQPFDTPSKPSICFAPPCHAAPRSGREGFDDEQRRQERVHERLDPRVRSARIVKRPPQLIHHVPIVQGVERAQAQQLRQVERREV